MKNVTVIFTVHKDNGAANSLALLELLERLRPDLIFLEVPTKGFENYTCSQGLENRAITTLLKRANTELVPIDNVMPTQEDFQLYNRLFDFFDAQSADMGSIKELSVSQLVRSYGFKYLNSDEYIKAQIELEDHHEKLVDVLGDSEIKSIYRKWKSIISERENRMLDNIFLYCQQYGSFNAAYLVGAGHATSLEKKVLDRFQSIPDVNWRIGYY